MKPFSHFNATTINEAVSVLRRYKGKAHLISAFDRRGDRCYR